MFYTLKSMAINRRTGRRVSVRPEVAPYLLFVVAMLTCAVFAAATTNEGGEYTYTGSPNDNRTTGQTGDQIWNVQNPISMGNFWPGRTTWCPTGRSTEARRSRLQATAV